MLLLCLILNLQLILLICQHKRNDFIDLECNMERLFHIVG